MSIAEPPRAIATTLCSELSARAAATFCRRSMRFLLVVTQSRVSRRLIAVAVPCG
jgi:hypothetical protein